MFIRGKIVFLLCVFTTCDALDLAGPAGPRGVHVVRKRAELETAPTPKVLIDTAQELKVQFIALYILFPMCLVECCICLPIVLGLVLGICATVPGCRIHKSLSKKVREEYILEQEAHMPPPNIFPPTTIYPGNMTVELPPYEAYALP